MYSFFLTSFHPSYYLNELIKNKVITKEQLVHQLQQPIEVILSDNLIITQDISIKLSKLLGTSDTMWLNLYQSYLNKKQ